jgi:hypothetical protein
MPGFLVKEGKGRGSFLSLNCESTNYTNIHIDGIITCGYVVGMWSSCSDWLSDLPAKNYLFEFSLNKIQKHLLFLFN